MGRKRTCDNLLGPAGNSELDTTPAIAQVLRFSAFFIKTCVVLRCPDTTASRVMAISPPLASTQPASVFWRAQPGSVVAVLQCNRTAPIQDCLQKAQRLSDLEEQVPKKIKKIKLNFFLLCNQEMRKGKITLNFKERKLEFLHTAKKTIKEMKNLQVIE